MEEFEKITKRFKDKKLKLSAPKKAVKEVGSLIKCPSCGEDFTYVQKGPRCGFGRCECGFAMMS